MAGRDPYRRPQGLPAIYEWTSFGVEKRCDLGSRNGPLVGWETLANPIPSSLCSCQDGPSLAFRLKLDIEKNARFPDDSPGLWRAHEPP